jgi:hypothetical protein
MRDNVAVTVGREQEPGRGIHSRRCKRETVLGVQLSARAAGASWWRRLGGSVLGVVVVALAIPSAGCIGDLMCSENCFGNIDCAIYSSDECSRHGDCTFSGRCLCLQAGCDKATADACGNAKTAPNCAVNTSCIWREGCVGSESCMLRFDDAASCNSNSACRWERNCN